MGISQALLSQLQSNETAREVIFYALSEQYEIDIAHFRKKVGKLLLEGYAQVDEPIPLLQEGSTVGLLVLFTGTDLNLPDTAIQSINAALKSQHPQLKLGMALHDEALMAAAGFAPRQPNAPPESGLAGQDTLRPPSPSREEPSFVLSEPIDTGLFNIPVECLVGKHPYFPHALRLNGIFSLGDLVNRTEQDLHSMRAPNSHGFEIITALGAHGINKNLRHTYGLSLGMDVPPQSYHKNDQDFFTGLMGLALRTMLESVTAENVGTYLSLLKQVQMSVAAIMDANKSILTEAAQAGHESTTPVNLNSSHYKASLEAAFRRVLGGSLPSP